MRKYPLNKVEYYSTFKDMIEALPKGREDQPAISWFTRKGEEKGVTLGEFREDVRNLQAYFVKNGFSGKHIAILGENSYEWLLVYFAATYCGAVSVCIDIEQPDETIQQMIQMADVSAMFCLPSLEELCIEVAKNGEQLFSLTGGSDRKSTRDLIEAGREIRENTPKSELETSVCADSTASIVFTSGTTSISKPVMLSHEAILTNACDALANVAIGKIAFTSLPFYHTYGMTCSVLSMLIGKAQLYINGNLKTVMRDIQLAKPHTLLTVPLMLETIYSKMWMTAEEMGKANGLRKLFELKKLQNFFGIKTPGKTLDALREKCFGKIRLVICGGAHMSCEIMKTFQLMGVLILQGYGITECAPLVSVNRNKANKLDSVGVVTANCKVKLVDGEIFVSGKNLMKGYYNAPELTAEVMDGEWFATGDVGYIDKDGYLFITGRKKNLIVFKNGKKLSPEKIEELIKKIPLVQDVVVYGSLSGVSSDDVQVAASIYPDKEKTEGMTRYEILESLQKDVEQINRTLPLYQQIQMVNIREQEFSKTALQKIKRHLV